MASRQPIYFNPAAALERCNQEQSDSPMQFHRSLPNYAPTPLVSLPDLATELGVRAVFIKDESNRFNLPSFKVLGASRGCFRAITSHLGLSQTVDLEELGRHAQDSAITLVAATEGNHGRAVAFMAQLLGITSIIFVPEHMNEKTRSLIAGEGAHVVIVEGDYDRSVQEASCHAQKTRGALLIQDTAFEGYENVPAWIVEGYSTMMVEIEEQLGELWLRSSVVVTPVGVGSLAHAVSRYCKAQKTPISVVAVEPDSASCLMSSLDAGKPVRVQTSTTIMDGMNCGTVSSTAWLDLQRFVDACITVSCHESHSAVQYLSSRSVPAGPCGSATLAALRRLATAGEATSLLNEKSVVVLLSTEGKRDYLTSQDVSVDDAVGLTQARVWGDRGGLEIASRIEELDKKTYT